jgi:hypothetical protein
VQPREAWPPAPGNLGVVMGPDFARLAGNLAEI